MRVIKESEYNLNYNRKLIDTKHSIERFDDRYKGNLVNFKDKIIDIINNAISIIIGKHKDKKGQYGIHSKSSGIGMIIDWRPDFLSKKDTNQAILVTLLPIKNYHFFRDVSDELVVENILRDYVNFYKNKKIAIKENTSTSIKEDTLYITYWEDKLYDCSIDHFIFID